MGELAQFVAAAPGCEQDTGLSIEGFHSHLNRRDANMVGNIRIGTGVQQHSQNVYTPVHGGAMQGCIAILIADMNIRPSFEEQAHGRVVTDTRSKHEWSVARSALCLDVGPRIQQEGDVLSIRLESGNM